MHDPVETLVFVANTPDGIDWTRIVLTDNSKIGDLIAGSAYFSDPAKYSAPPWLSTQKATEIYELHTGERRTFESRKEAHNIFWNYFRPFVKPAEEKDFGKAAHLRKPEEKQTETKTGEKMAATVKKPEPTKRTRVTIDPSSKIAATGKQPKSEKNAARLALYRRSKLSTILEKHPEITLADIKYDIKCGYAEILA